MQRQNSERQFFYETWQSSFWAHLGPFWAKKLKTRLTKIKQKKKKKQKKPILRLCVAVSSGKKSKKFHASIFHKT